MKEVRLNKYLADNNYSTRRGADKLIEEGNVLVNGKVAKLGTKVGPEDEVVVVGSKPKPYVYYAYYKPRGVVTFGAQGKEKEIKGVSGLPDDVFPIGRLDKDSEGLLILTNDGRITKALLDPDQEHEKEYQVTVEKEITHQFLVRLRQGVHIGKVGSIRNYRTKPCKIRRVDKRTFDIVLTEGKNRQIRKMAGSQGYKVLNLVRFRVGDIELGKLKPNQYRKLKKAEVAAFFEED